jgi:diaminopimelate decarboxylase
MEVIEPGSHRAAIAPTRAAQAQRTDALPEVAIHYATRCNPDPRILGRLHATGSGFEIASYSELQILSSLGVRAADVIFSSPVKP